MKTVYWRATEPELRIVSNFSWGAGYYYPMLRKFFDTFFEGDFPNRGKEVFHKHYDEVRSLVPADNLLEFSVKDGWGPLCEFLDEEVPPMKFPYVNDNSDFVTRCKTRNRMQMCNVAFRAVVVSASMLASGYALSRLWKSYSS